MLLLVDNWALEARLIVGQSCDANGLEMSAALAVNEAVEQPCFDSCLMGLKSFLLLTNVFSALLEKGTLLLSTLLYWPIAKTKRSVLATKAQVGGGSKTLSFSELVNMLVITLDGHKQIILNGLLSKMLKVITRSAFFKLIRHVLTIWHFNQFQMRLF